MGSFPQNMYRSGFLSFLYDSNIDFEENMDFIQISNGCDLRFWYYNVALTQIAVYLLHKNDHVYEVILLNFGYVIPSTL